MDKNQISTSYEKYDRVFARAFSKKQKGKFYAFYNLVQAKYKSKEIAGVGMGPILWDRNSPNGALPVISKWCTIE